MLDLSDKIHDIFMSISPRQFEILSEKYHDLTLKALSRFKTHITGQSWGFSYTDTIGRQCNNLYVTTTITEFQAILLYIIVEVGSNHNRWYVMGIAKDLLIDISDASAALEIAIYLKPLHRELNRLRVSKVDVIGALKELFDE